MITLVRKEKLKPSGFLLYWYCSIIEEDLHFGTSELIEDTPENREVLQEAWQYYLQHEDNINDDEHRQEFERLIKPISAGIPVEPESGRPANYFSVSLDYRDANNVMYNVSLVSNI